MKELKVAKGILTVFLALGLIACDRGTIESNLIAESESGNNNIYRTYRVDFSEDKNETLISATYSIGGRWGTTVDLKEPASVTFNGNTPNKTTDEFDGGEAGAFFVGFLFPPAWLLAGASGTSYYTSLPGPAPSVNILFSDNSGTPYNDYIQIPNLSLGLPAFVNASGFYINIQGQTEADSQIRVQLSQGSEYKSVSGSGSSVSVTLEDLANFSNGPIEVQVEVSSRRSIEEDASSLGGSIRTTYSFSKRSIQLKW